jgi:hypothetical protein
MTDRLNRSNMLRTLSALLSVLLIATTVSAQRGPGEGRMPGMGMPPPGAGPGFGATSMERLLRPDYHARDMAILARQLELDHSQRPIFEMLLEDYREAFRDAAFELDRALRHMRIRRTEDILERRFDREQGRLPEGAIHMPAPERVVLDGVDVSGMSIRSNVEIAAERVVISSNEDVDSMVFAIATEPEFAMRQDTGERDSGQYETVSRVRFTRIMTDDSDDGGDVESVREREIPAEVQERIDRMRERIRQRMEERIQQQREEMRLRGIDPDEDVEPMEPEEIAELAKSFLTQKEQLRNRFESDARVLLTARQREMLPETLRIIRRLNSLPDSRLSGEQLDLVRLLDDEHLLSPHRLELEAVLHEYTDALDEALRVRSHSLERADIDRFLARERNDHEKMLQLADTEMDRRVAVRHVNETFARRIAAILREEHREQFETAFESQAYPQVARATLLERLLPRLLESDELTNEQREALEHLWEVHATAAATYRQNTIQTIREREVREPREMLEFAQRMRDLRESGEDMRRIDWNAMRPPMPVHFSLRNELFDLEQPYFEQLRSIVPQNTLEQIASGDETVQTVLTSYDRMNQIREAGERRWRRQR